MTDMPPPGDNRPSMPPPGPPPPPGAPPSFSPPGYPSSNPSVPPGYAPFGHAPIGPPEQKSAMLLAGGIVAVVLSAFIAFLGLALLLIGEAFDSFGDGIGDIVRVIGLVVLAFAAFGGAGGIGAIMRRRWGKICSIVFGSINLVFGVLSLFGDGDSPGSTFGYLAMSVAIVFLCAKGPAST